MFDEVAGHLNAQHGRLIDLTAWLLANRQEWQGDGLWTPSHYLAWRCGVSPATARKIVDVAKRVDELPESIELVRRGELSLDQLMPIVHKAPAWADGQAASLAPRITVSQVQRVCRDTNWDWAPGAPEPEDPLDTETHSSDEHSMGSAPESAANSADNPVRSPEPENRVTYGFGADGR